MNSIAKYIDEEKDVAFLIGKEKEQTKFVLNLLEKLNLTTEQVADIAGVPVEFVKKIKRTLTGNK